MPHRMPAADCQPSWVGHNGFVPATPYPADPRRGQQGCGQQRSVVLLGSTGSIGTQALDVVAGAPDRFAVTGICAGGGNLELLARQAVAMAGAAMSGLAMPGWPTELAERLAAAWPASGDALPTVHAGPAATAELAGLDCDVVLNGVAGAQGLRATLAGLQAGRTVALANKESLIAGGPLVLAAAAPGQLVPVDSEHSALAQCLRGGSAAEVSRLVLTASGGPFRGRRRDQLTEVSPDQAMAHPDLVDGPADHHQLGDPGQQGPGADRGTAAVRGALRPDRGGRPPAVDRALDGRVRRRRDAGPGQPAGHAAADRAGAGLAGPGARRGRGLDWTKAQDWTFEPVDDRRSRRSSWPGPPVRPAAARRRCSTRPTRSWSRPFTADAVDSWR